MKKSNLEPLYNMMFVSFKINKFLKVLKYASEAFENNKEDAKLIEGLARVNFYLGNKKESLKLDDTKFPVQRTCWIFPGTYVRFFVHQNSLATKTT